MTIIGQVAVGWVGLAAALAFGFCVGWTLCAKRWDGMVSWAILGRWRVRYLQRIEPWKGGALVDVVEVVDEKTDERVEGPSAAVCLFKLYDERKPKPQSYT